MRCATRGNVVAAIAVLAMAGVTWPDPSLAETIVDVATFAQLKAAVHDKTSGPSTLRITNDIYYPTDGSVPSGGIILKYAVRIVGACSSTSLVVSGTVATGTCMLDAKEVDRHFDVKTVKGSTAEVVFEKLALVNGKPTRYGDDDGGAVYAYETGATRFENVIFKDNTAPDGGGAVGATYSGKATFTSCRFLGNKAKWSPYSSGSFGGAVMTFTSASSFTACTFENNEAGHAGAVHLDWGSSSTFTLCTFLGNRALDGESNSPSLKGHNVLVSGAFYGISSDPTSASFYACTFLDLLSDSNHGVRKRGEYSSFTFYDNVPTLAPPSPPPSPPPPLTYSYSTGSWTPCSSSCDEGTQTRSVTCKRSDGQSVSDSYCSGSKPSTSQSCNNYDGGDCKYCDVSGSTLSYVDGRYYKYGNQTCDGKPVYYNQNTYQHYDEKNGMFLYFNTNSQWMFGGEGSIETCGTSGHAYTPSGTADYPHWTGLNWKVWRDPSWLENPNLRVSCPGEPTRPISSPPPPAYTYSYTTGSWSSCSSSCGGGTQTRSVTCKRSDGYGQSVSDSYCSESKPSAYQSCNTQVCATPKKKGNAAGIAVGVIFAVIVLCVAPWAWSYYKRKVAKDDRDDTVYDMVPVQVAKAHENCLEDFFFFGRKKPNGGGRKFHTMDYAVPPGSNTLAPILVTVPDGMPGAGQELQWKKPPAFSSGTVVSNITYYYDDIPPTSTTPAAITMQPVPVATTEPTATAAVAVPHPVATMPTPTPYYVVTSGVPMNNNATTAASPPHHQQQEVKTMPGGVATFVCTNPVLARASADVNDKLPDLEVNKLAEGVQILASEEGGGKWLRCASEGRFKGFYFPFYHPALGGAIFKKLDGDLTPAEDQGKQARSIEMMSVTHVPPPPPHQPEVAIPILVSVGGDEETTAAFAEDGKDIALALLASVRLDKYASAFEELGIRDVRDFFEVTDDDLTALGMSELEKRRFKKQVQSK